MNGLDASACAYYRIVLPLTTMERLGFPVEVILDDAKAVVSPHQRSSMFLESDISLIYQNISDMTVNMMKASKGFKPLRSMEDSDQVRWPPTFICDSDDDLFNVMPLNVTYGSLGTRDHTGRQLQDGEELGIAHPFDLAPPEAQTALNDKYPYPIVGTRGDLKDARYIYDEDHQWHCYISLWRDGHNVNYKENRKRLDVWKETVGLANLVTCSTAGAERYIKKEIGEHIPTFISPNAIDFDAYYKVDLQPHPGEVRILWEGSATHHEGLWPISESIGRLAKKYPQTTWYFFGAKYKWAAAHLPAERTHFIDWVHYEAYKLRLGTLGHDISYAPLIPYVFNESRSAIRWYENSALWKPAATVAQYTGAYKDEIQEGKTGLLFKTPEEFEEKMSAVIENETFRKELASNAKDWIRTNREVKAVTTKLFQKWVEVREGHKQTMPADTAELIEVK